MGMEYEKKYCATAMQQEEILQAYPGETQTVRMHTRYYDTPSGALAARRYTLRCREENDVRVCTVKAPLSGPGRGEWETQCDDVVKALPILCAQGAPKELLSLAGEGLLCICGAQFTRRLKLVKTPDCTVEIACDAGVLTGGGKQLPFLEVEVELKEGTPEAADAFAQSLADKFCLVPERRSKFRRALALYQGEM